MMKRFISKKKYDYQNVLNDVWFEQLLRLSFITVDYKPLIKKILSSYNNMITNIYKNLL